MKKLIRRIKYWLKIVPDWKECVHASCWDGDNAQRRMMNILSPKFSEGKVDEYIKWMKGRGCDTAHVILMNGGDGEGAGYTAIDNVKLTQKRVKKLFLEGFAIVPWIITDDSSAYARQLFANPGAFMAAFKSAGIFDYSSYVVLGLEANEYGNLSQWTAVRDAVKKYAPKLKIGIHHTSGKYVFAGLADIVLDQLDPERASKAAITASIKKIIAMGKAAVGFEYARHANRPAAEYALQAGAAGCGNW